MIMHLYIKDIALRYHALLLHGSICTISGRVDLSLSVSWNRDHLEQ
jgi:hypothetical protein